MVNSCVLLSDNDPLLRIGQVQILLYIKALSDGMVIDFLMFTSRPSPMEWSLIFLCLQQDPLRWNGHCFLSLHQGPLQWNGHWYPYVYIKALSNGMVVDFFVTTRPSPIEWSFISFFTSRPSLMQWSLIFVTSRPSPMEWSLIFLCLHQGPLRWNGHWFSYVYIKALSDGMVIDFLMFTSRPSPMEWSLIFLCLQQDPLQWNGH